MLCRICEDGGSFAESRVAAFRLFWLVVVEITALCAVAGHRPLHDVINGWDLKSAPVFCDNLFRAEPIRTGSNLEEAAKSTEALFKFVFRVPDLCNSLRKLQRNYPDLILTGHDARPATNAARTYRIKWI